MPRTFEGVRDLLSASKRIVIVTHWSPDGDAMGSSLGLFNYLIQLGHQVQVIVPNAYPSNLNWLPGNELVGVYGEGRVDLADKVGPAEVIFCLDFNTLARIEQLGLLVAQSSAFKILIDHHRQPDDFADFMLHDILASSTCELVFGFIEGMGHNELLSKDVANCLYTGIMTDTGSFRFPSTTSRTHFVAANLLDHGADNAMIYEQIHDACPASRLKLMGYALNQKLLLLEDFSTGVISLSEEEHVQFNYQKGDTEGLVNFPLSVLGIRFSAFFAERDGLVKCSFRSKGDFDVNLFARTHFNGGGHKNAAGGSSTDTLLTTVAKFKALLPAYAKELAV